MADTTPQKPHKNFLEEGLNLPLVEEKVLKFWDEHHIFEKSIEARQGKKHFVFYEGPPYANGRPGIHHVLARVYKDIILRYKSMRGYFVPRKAGWDTHGLPVELAAEKALGIKNKVEIEKFGIERFNAEAKKAVWTYKDEWEQITRRMGYWLDLKNAYVTYAPEYIESIWWSLKRIWERKLLFKGHKVVPWCTRCGTALSSHELAQGYQEVKDNSVYMKFRVKAGQKIGKWVIPKNTFILSWTTTPWTLPGNVALAVGKNIRYIVAEVQGEHLVIAKDLAGKLIQGINVEKELGGKDLVGIRYEPLFNVKPLQSSKSHRVYPADFVTTTDGTGVVHTAVMYGEDDYQLGVKVGLPQHHTVDEVGRFTKEVKGLAGLYVKAKETEERIMKTMEKDGTLLRIELYTHEYPHCWRCNTPVLYYARNSWFIGMSRLRAKLLSENKKINWVPAHVKEGRFGEWLREVKDWNLSRERFWGAPLPIWECAKCAHTEVVGGMEDLEKKITPPRNRYILMRHGEAESNLKRIIDSGEREFHLTTIGRDQALRAGESLKKKKVDMIIASDVLRTKETAAIVAKVLGIKKVAHEKRLREIHLGELAGCHDGRYGELFPTYISRFNGAPQGGESLKDLRARVWSVIQGLEKKYKGKTILLVSHEYPIWMLTQAMSGWSERQAIVEKEARDAGGPKEARDEDFVTFADPKEIPLRMVPRDATGEVDLHRPFVDSFSYRCTKCKKGDMRRVREVADVWYDSGSMPFAQLHYPFENKAEIAKGTMYPADYISEGMDQTRGWFYTMHAIATALGFSHAYKNVVSLGLINDKHGQKMSKSKGNIVDPWMIMQKYGVDAVRWYFFSATPPGEPKNFDELEVAKAFRRVHLIAYNSLVFYETYADKSARLTKAPSYELDQWILHRLNVTVEEATKQLDVYAIRESALSIEQLVDDLSRWYIRRSRRRLQKPESDADYKDASATLYEVLHALARLLAPFTPFFAEALYAKLNGEEESVHLSEWPASHKERVNKPLGEAMEKVRVLASAALAKRAEIGIKVRQPLASLTTNVDTLKSHKALLAILEDEANVKKILFDAKASEGPVLDTVITEALKEEGMLREFTRLVQGMRQDAGLHPKDVIALMIEAVDEWSVALKSNEAFLKKEVGAESISFTKNDKVTGELSTKVDGSPIWVGIRKI